MSELPVFDIVETLDEDNKVVSSKLTPAYNPEIERFLIENDLIDTKEDVKEEVKVSKRNINHTNVNNITPTKRKEKLKAINEQYFNNKYDEIKKSNNNKNVKFSQNHQIRMISNHFDQLNLEKTEPKGLYDLLEEKKQKKQLVYSGKPIVKDDLVFRNKKLSSINMKKSKKGNSIKIPNNREIIKEEIKSNEVIKESNESKLLNNEPKPIPKKKQSNPIANEIIKTKIDYQALNENFDDMVNAYLLGIYDDDLGIEYDMPNSIIENVDDIEKYNSQVLLVEKDIKENGNDDTNDDNNNNDINDNDTDNQPLLSEEIIENLDIKLNNQLEEDSDLTFNSEILNQEIINSYQQLRQLLINKNSGFKNQELEIEPIDENGNLIKFSRFKSAQIDPTWDLNDI